MKVSIKKICFIHLIVADYAENTPCQSIEVSEDEKVLLACGQGYFVFVNGALDSYAILGTADVVLKIHNELLFYSSGNELSYAPLDNPSPSVAELFAGMWEK